MSIEFPTHPVESVCRRLREDPLTAAIFRGGIYLSHGGGDGEGVHPINPEDTPGAYELDGGFKSLLPTALLTVGADGPMQAGRDTIRRIFLLLHVFQAEGYSEIRDGLVRARQVLHKTNTGTYRPSALTDTDLFYLIEYVDTPLSGLTDTSVVTGSGKRPACYEAARFVAYTDFLEPSA